MRHLIFATAAVTAMSLLASPCFANRAAADACAANLPAKSKLIYAATIGAVKPDTDLKTIVRANTRSLVMSGKISRSEAREAAEAAGACLKQAR